MKNVIIKYLFNWIKPLIIFSSVYISLSLYNSDREFLLLYQLIFILFVSIYLILSPIFNIASNTYTTFQKTMRIYVLWLSIFNIFLIFGFLTKTSSFISRVDFILSMVVGANLDVILAHLVAYNQKIYRTKKNILVFSDVANCKEKIYTLFDSENTFQFYKTSEIDKFEATQTNLNPDMVIYFTEFEPDYSFIKKCANYFLCEVSWIGSETSLLKGKKIEKYGNFAQLKLNNLAYMENSGTMLLKRFFDFSLSLLLIIIFLPLMLLLSMLIRLESKGSPIFRQERGGINNTKFKIFKFRSMFEHKDGSVRQATQNDARVTKIGKFLRRTSLDELPQLFNVLLGEMSLVGPRPHAIVHNEEYTKVITNFMHRHKILPGMTGLAQIHGYRGETKSVDDMKHRVRLDLEYLYTWSIYLDLIILIKTPLALFKKNIY